MLFRSPRLPFLAVVEHARDGLLQTLWHLVADDPNAVFVLCKSHADVHAYYTTALYRQWHDKQLISRLFWDYRGLDDAWRSLRESNPCFSLERAANKCNDVSTRPCPTCSFPTPGPADPEITSHRAAVRSHEPSEAELRSRAAAAQIGLLARQAARHRGERPSGQPLCPLLPHVLTFFSVIDFEAKCWWAHKDFEPWTR